MYQGSNSRIKCKNVLTEPIMISQDVQQGNVLCSLLFNIFINDFGNDMYVYDSPILYGTRVSHLLYADDLVLLSTTEIGLQRNIDKVHEFCKNWELNVDKSRIPKDKFMFNFSGEELEHVSQYKYFVLPSLVHANFQEQKNTWV